MKDTKLQTACDYLGNLFESEDGNKIDVYLKQELIYAKLEDADNNK